MTPRSYLELAVFACTYLALALGRIPGLDIERVWIAVAGALCTLAAGALTPVDGFRAINWETIVLLTGMMVLVGSLRIAGLFDRLTSWIAERVRSPHQFLAATILLSGVLSALFVNDVVCIALTPLLLHLARRFKMSPMPHLIALATAANIGSAATIVGNPQNMIIGSFSGIPYLHFAAKLGPVALAGLMLDYAVISLLFRRELARRPQDTETSAPGARIERASPLLVKSTAIALVAILLFTAGVPQAWVAAGAAVLILLGHAGRTRPSGILREIDWKLLLLFVGLFIVVRGFEIQVMRPWGLDRWPAFTAHPVTLLSLGSAALSNLVSNVPAVLIFKPLVQAMPALVQKTAWLALAMSSTLSGNFTVLGSIANLIVVECARREGFEISFWDYFRVGLPITLLSGTFGVAWLSWA